KPGRSRSRQLERRFTERRPHPADTRLAKAVGPTSAATIGVHRWPHVPFPSGPTSELRSMYQLRYPARVMHSDKAGKPSLAAIPVPAPIARPANLARTTIRSVYEHVREE